MTALDELRAALHQERWLIASYTDELQANTDAALARVEAELAHAQRLYLEACECGSGHARIAELEAELAALRETNQKLNRRCQSAEAGLSAKLTSGPSFGRALANSAATMYHEQLAERDAELADLRTRPTLEQVTDALSALDIPYMYRGADVLIRRDVFRAIRAIYGEAETTTERPNG